MDDEIGKDAPKIQADNQSIAIGEINITGTVTGNITIGHTVVQPADARLRHELGILLKNVQTTWIQGVLERSVHEAALLELGLELREEAVDNPWRMVIEGPDQTRESLPRGRKIKDIFEEANRLLLILGEPGSGKTTTLLQLARDLIAEVDSAFTQPVPVILNLSTWTNKAQPLDEWMITELNSKYRLPKKDGQRWLKERRILPLLDGLDEVRAENRAACVEKLNHLVTDYGLQGMVVCSRIKDYTALNVRLAFYRAIYIQPLTPEQVDEYLNEAGDKLASLRTVLQSDEALGSMAQSPLILNIMSLAYQNTSTEELSNPTLNTDKERRKHLFDTYISRMFKRKAKVQQYENEQTKQRLSWLARNMQKHNQEIFLIEGVQPSWLSARLWQWIYILTSRLVSGLVSALIFGWLFGIWDSENLLLLVLIFSLVFGVMGSRRNLKNDIKTVEALRWSWRKAARGLLIGGIVGLVFLLILGLAETFMDLVTLGTILLEIGPILTLIFGDPVTFGSILLEIGPTFLLGFGLGGAIYNGLSIEIIETKYVPNRGILLSIRNAIFVGLGVILSCTLIFMLISVLIFGLSDGPGELSEALGSGLYAGLFSGLPLGMIGTLLYGGLDVIQHYTLRLILLLQRRTPANYARFLDYAVDRIFLQKVGGGYRFIHRLLLEHFAEMNTARD